MFNRQDMDLAKLWRTVQENGGSLKVTMNKDI